jgi:hypothetical protein
VPDEELLYLNPTTGIYFLRKRDQYADTHVSLQTTRVGKAKQLRDDYKAAIRLQRLGIVPPAPPAPEPAPAPLPEKKPDPQPAPKPEHATTVGDVLRKYEKDGYLTEDAEKRKGNTLQDEIRNTGKLLQFWDLVPIGDVRRSKLVAYKTWRTEKKNRRKACNSKGLRAVDIDLRTLSNAFKYSAAIDYCDGNPVADKPRFQKGAMVKHCREFCPDDADELHDAAALLMQNPRSVALGFQLLAEAYSSLRCQEMLRWGTKKIMASSLQIRNTATSGE